MGWHVFRTAHYTCHSVSLQLPHPQEYAHARKITFDKKTRTSIMENGRGNQCQALFLLSLKLHWSVILHTMASMNMCNVKSVDKSCSPLRAFNRLSAHCFDLRAKHFTVLCHPHRPFQHLLITSLIPSCDNHTVRYPPSTKQRAHENSNELVTHSVAKETWWKKFFLEPTKKQTEQRQDWGCAQLWQFVTKHVGHMDFISL